MRSFKGILRHLSGRAAFPGSLLPSGTGGLGTGSLHVLCAGVLLLVASGFTLARGADEELNYYEYHALWRAADRLDHLAVLEPSGAEVGLYLVLGDRYGLVHLYYLTHGKVQEVWKSKQLDGVVDEVLVGDRDGDRYNDCFAARTSSGMLYVWEGQKFDLVYESLTTDFQKIYTFDFGNVDDDPASELIVNADRHIYYLDGVTFNREWTSPYEYQATRMCCGDVDGDRRNEIILNTGQVLDSRNGDVKWDDEVFGNRIELLDIDGDGIPEILSENDGTALKVYDADHKKEKHMQ
jgi:hypothetical protein